MFDRLAALFAAGAFALPALAQPVVQESAFWAAEVTAGQLDPAVDRIPDTPLIVDLEAKGREFGMQGGTLRTMVTRSKDVRQMVVYGYARLVGYDETYQLKADILRDVDVDETGSIFTLHLRPGHRWSDGAPFTSADFEYWWDHVANKPELSPNGPPEVMRVGDDLGTMRFPDTHTVVVEFPRANPVFLQSLAQAAPPFIYRPSHYLKQFHVDFNTAEAMEEMIDRKRVRSWAPLHNKMDNMYQFDNPELPTLQPWMPSDSAGNSRQLFVRNPYFHRVDAQGTHLPYIDVVEMTIVGSGLVAAKSNAGQSDLQARGLDFRDVSILKKGEADGAPYRTFLWSNGAASQIAIYPNLNFADPVWREVMRDARFRRALSLGIDRRMINRALYFGLGKEGGMTALSRSPFFDAANLTKWAIYDAERANKLLDEMGLTERTAAGIRLLPDGRPMEFVIETAGERQEVGNALAIITDTWRDIGVKLIMRPLDRDILRNRVFTGVTMASIWYGWDNGIPQAYTPPSYLAPTDQVFFAWPKWGQYYQTHGSAGEPVDMPTAARLLELNDEWLVSQDTATRERIWKEMLSIHADQQFGIGVLSEAPQPVVVNDRLRNVPEFANWTWDPGAHFGVHRIDEFFFAEDAEQIAQVSE